jgi:4-amino-4-deoxy-L-arabinose transferase-like glycosyltransferase
LRVTARRYTALLLGSLAALTLVRLVVAGMAPLAPDEAYYWVFSRALAPGYLDHPPMVALWIRLGTLIAGPGALGVRLLGPLSAALGSILLYDAAERLFPSRQAGAVAATLWNATLLAGVGAVIMTPDTPLLFFWTACLWALARLLDSGRSAWWLAIGLFAGLDLASKYTALLLWVGIGLWLLLVPSQRHWWRSAMMWSGALLGAVVFMPVVLWNAQHHWASFLRQGGRVENWQPGRAPQFLAELVGGQIGLATPLLFVLFVAGVVWATRRAWRGRDPACTLLAALVLPGAAVFFQHALGARVQGNWPAILYPAAVIAAAALGARVWALWRWPAVALGLAVTLLVYAQAATFALALPPRLDPIAHQLAGWKGLAASVDEARMQQHVDCVAADDYGTAAELARDLPTRIAVLAVGPRWRLFALPSAAASHEACVFVGRSGITAPPGWRHVQSLGDARRVSGPASLQRFTLWRVTGPQALLPVVVLPR